MKKMKNKGKDLPNNIILINQIEIMILLNLCTGKSIVCYLIEIKQKHIE